MYPILQVFAGPNGSGKSTVTSVIPMIGVYVNADLIQAQLQCTPLEAAQNAERTREYLVDHGESFTMETVLSTNRNMSLIRRARDSGFYVICIFMLTCHPDINVQRVADRVARGGHDVPEEKTRKRYKNALANLARLPGECDELYVYDNSAPRGQGEPALIVQALHGKVTLHPSPYWDQSRLEALMDGRFVQEYLDK